MPRRKAAIKRETLPDPLYGSEQITRLVNVVMREGKKSIAERIVYTALTSLVERLKKEHKTSADSEADAAKAAKGKKSTVATKSKSAVVGAEGGEEVLDALKKCLGNVAPTVEVKSRRVGGATYQVPVEVAADRGFALAMRWVVDAAKTRAEKTMAQRLSAELYEAYMGRGASIKTRDDVHRMAKANQAFAHYRW
jgi:small subunit ribosomal protein S7